MVNPAPNRPTNLLDAAPEAVNLTNCDREPIHIPGLIQPHGALLVLQEPDLKIVQVSDNVSALIGRSPQSLLDQPLSNLLAAEQVDQIRRCLAEDFESANPLQLLIQGQSSLLRFDGIVNQSAESLILLELEPQSGSSGDFFEFYQHVHRTVTRIQKASTLREMCQVVVEDIRRLTGFERVMGYQFDPAYAGSVIAEVTDCDTRYLGLRYPASDIPQQARHLYALNWLRLIPNACYQPAGLIPPQHPTTAEPLDLSFSVLRSVSPLHLEYMQNMGVAASMSISLMRGRKLWGLIACHHNSPKHVPYNIRTACQFIGQVMSSELVNKEVSEDADYRMRLKSLQTEFVSALSKAENFLDGIRRLEGKFLELVNASGAVVYSGGQWIKVGTVPTDEQLQDLVAWIKPRLQQNLFQTRSLPQTYPPAEAFQAIASGVMALEISRVHHNFILWFRPEVIHTVSWGGEPNKPSETLSDGSLYLTPRKSFDRWQETVHGCAQPWRTVEIDIVLELRNLIVGIVLRQADEMASVNFELQRSNDELDSFAYIASHDLKEPLRGIHNYANFLMEDYEDQLDEDGVHKLQTLVRLTQRMENLLNSLLHFSRLGRAELVRDQVDLDALVRQATTMLKMSRPQNNVEFRIPRPLPTVRCDRAQIMELFTNLISNAIKYNDKTAPWVEVGLISPSSGEVSQPNGTGASPSEAKVFYVQDNGIGISPSYFDKIFQIFHRLHGRDDFGGGTGAGLTIVQKIVERHGGKIWLESTPGHGTTFFFTL
ncbi:MAG: ATP-binding protein, partial [Elainellaceae cyanobacterium]